MTTVRLDGAQRAWLHAICRRHGMRLAGPGSFGVAVPGTGLDATLAAPRLVPGKAGLVTQSGGLGYALAGQLSRLGIGVSSFASVGCESDVSARDLLMWWEQDGLTGLAIVLAGSFASPRRFARTVSRISRSMPVLTMDPGPAADGMGAAASPAMAAARRGRYQALFEQAGIVATASLGELLGTAAFLSAQPIPAGGRVSVISGTGAAAVRAAAACTGAGLLVAGHDADAALLVAPAPGTATGLTEYMSTDAGIPLAVVVPGQLEAVRLLPVRAAGTPARAGSEARRVPAYASCENAACALANAVKLGTWRAKAAGQRPEFGDLHPAQHDDPFLRLLP